MDLIAKDLLQVHPNTYALVISMENITLNWYFGNERSMLVPNGRGSGFCFQTKGRTGGNPSTNWFTRFRLHKGSDDKCFSCVFKMEDPDGKVGVFSSLKTKITNLGPFVLPMSKTVALLCHISR